ncbi:MAG: glycine zipper 2TM domain-containing protein [Betaproteobacteria bacterium]|nr:glycine zipper 2TM domain-containing protein [Betaproteobacteria bacterium]
MNGLTSRFALAAGLLAILLATGCSSMSKDTAIGAGIGGVTGAVLTDGSPAGAAVGAVVGGVIGNEVDKKK